MTRLTGVACGFALAMAGCATEGGAGLEPPVQDGGADSGPMLDGSRLERVSDSALTLGYGEQTTLRVRYLGSDGDPRANETVRFALTGSTADSSLLRLEDRTNGDGIAETRLRAGQKEAVFSVRISAAQAPDIFVDVAVSNDGFGILIVELDYDGARRPLQQTVTLHAGASCDEASGTTTRRQSTAYDEPAEARFLALPSGISYAVRARLEGKELVTLASGCVDEVDVSAGDEEHVTVTVMDQALEPQGRFPVELELDSTAVADTASRTARAAGNTRVRAESSQGSGNAVQAALLLDALQVTLEANQDTDAMAALAAAREQDAAATLQSLLDDAVRGAYLAVDTLADAVAGSLVTTRVSADLELMQDAQTVAASWQPSRVTAMSEGGDRVVQTDVPESSQSELDASFEADRDRIRIESLRFALPWGSLANRAVHDTTTENGDSPRIHDDLGCTQLAQWVEQQDELRDACDTSCVEASCGRALQWLKSAMEEQLLALDVERPTTTLQGLLSMEDLDGDLRAERLSSSDIQGHWGSVEQGDTLSGSLHTLSIE